MDDVAGSDLRLEAFAGAFLAAAGAFLATAGAFLAAAGAFVEAAAGCKTDVN